MKKHNMMRVASALAVVTLLSTSLISGTLAKYTSEKSADSTAQVANWKFNVNGKDIVQKDFTFDLFKRVLDTRALNDDANVKNEEGKNIVAPGTWGYVDLTIQNTSDVTAAYSIQLSSTLSHTAETKLPLQYAIKKKTSEQEDSKCPDTFDTSAGAVGWTDNIDNVNVSENLMPDRDALTYRVYWKWDFGDVEATNTDDTRIGTEGTAQQMITAKIKAEQVDN